MPGLRGLHLCRPGKVVPSCLSLTQDSPIGIAEGDASSYPDSVVQTAA